MPEIHIGAGDVSPPVPTAQALLFEVNLSRREDRFGMNEDRENLMRTGTGFIVVAGSVWLLSVFAYVLVQSGIVSKEVPLINEFIAFSCGRRPIIPMIIGLFGLSLRGVASMMK